MQIIAECYAEDRAPQNDLLLEQAYENAKSKARKFREMGASVIEMGSRRRRTYKIQDATMKGLIDGYNGSELFRGTSNIHFAAKYGLTANGTMAHEIFSAGAAMYGVENVNNLILGKWADTYHGLLGIALPDTFTTDFFLRTFGPFYAKLFDGIRHDSGDFKEFFQKILAHYNGLKINPKSKVIVPSNGINSFDEIQYILDTVDNQMLISFGIGTWLTNDFDDLKALNMVIKLIKARKNQYEPWRHAVKLSDDAGKHNGDPDTIKDYFKRIAA
jgi:nicotinate phosphoribosyltransferase